jgi:hypothetical protein
MTNDTADMTHEDTSEKWIGPVRQVIRNGGRKIPLAPPLPGETEPFAWTTEAAEVVSMDVDGRAVESVTATAEDGRGKLLVKFKDGCEVTYDAGAVISTHECS